MRYCFPLLVLVILAGCSSYVPEMVDVSEITSPQRFNTMSPMPPFLRNVPQGNDSFSVGWRDGCNTYLGFTGSGLLQRRQFTYDINRSLKDRQYNSGFREGANICMYYTDTRPN